MRRNGNVVWIRARPTLHFEDRVVSNFALKRNVRGCARGDNARQILSALKELVDEGHALSVF